MADIGYARVSSYDQNFGRQLDGIQLDRIFEEKASARDTDRPILQECMQYVRESDVLHVHSIDRLARNLQDLVKLIQFFTKKGVVVKFHKENLCFTNEENHFQMLHLQILGAVAQFERALIRERQREGIAKAKAEGRPSGRPSALTKEQEKELVQKVIDRYSRVRLAKEYGISKATVYKIVERHGVNLSEIRK